LYFCNIFHEVHRMWLTTIYKRVVISHLAGMGGPVSGG
jgi:hypothetical protein